MSVAFFMILERGGIMSNQDVKLKCLRCKKYTINDHNAYKTRSDIDFNGLMPVCKYCMKEIYAGYYDQFDDIRNAILKTCRKLDIAYYNGVVDMVINQHKTSSTHPFQIYMQKLNSLGSKMGYGGTCFDEGEYILPRNEQAQIDEEGITAEGIKKWGGGYSPTDYIFLDNTLESYLEMSDAETITVSDLKVLKLICQEELTIRQKRLRGEDIQKNLDTFQKLMQTASIRPTDIKNASSKNMADSYGSWIEDIEQNEPAEFFEDKALFKDEDKIGDYLRKYVFRPMKNLITGSKDFNLD